MATLNAVTSAGLSDDGSDAALGLASIVAISVLSVALVAALQMPLVVDETGFEANAVAEQA
jgi:hypothetical protein